MMKKESIKDRARSKLLDQLVAEYVELFYVYAEGLCSYRDPFDSGDLVSETILKVHAKADLILRQPEEKRPYYVLVMMKRLYLNLKRQEKMPSKAAGKLTFDEKSDDVERVFMEKDSMANWERVIKAKIGERKAEIVMLHLEGYTFKEIAEMIGGNLTVENAKATNHRAMKEIAKVCQATFTELTKQ